MIIEKKSDSTGVFNLGSRNGISKGEFIKKVLNLTNLQCNLIESSILDFFNNRSLNMLMNVNKFEKEFNFILPDLNKEIEDEFKSDF